MFLQQPELHRKKKRKKKDIFLHLITTEAIKTPSFNMGNQELCLKEQSLTSNEAELSGKEQKP